MKKSLLILLLQPLFLNAQTTYVPDDNFENYLETHDADGNTVSVGNTSSMGNGISGDDTVTTASISSVTVLNLDSVGVTDITGLEDFTSLQYLDIDNNSLTNTDLDLTGVATLVDIAAQNCGITNVDLSGLTNLEHIQLKNNMLTTIDVSDNTVLDFFGLNGNSLTAINVLNNPNLTFLGIESSNLTSLDVSNNLLLTVINANDNNITGVVDLSLHTSLVKVRFQNNDLTGLNIANGNNNNITDYETQGNSNLSCVQVDDINYANTNFTDKEASTSFSTDCSSTLSNDNYMISTNGINFNIVPDKVEIYGLLGNLLLKTNNNHHIDITSLQTGFFYVVKYYYQGNTYTEKITINK